MKKTLLIASMSVLVSSAFALTAFDDASDAAYSDGWTGNGTEGFDNGGTGFVGWGFTSTANTTSEISSSTAVGSPGGDINSSGTDAFRIAANNGESFDVFRTFSSSLGAGDVFTFDLAANFRNGSKGVDIRSDNTAVFNFSIADDSYFFGQPGSGINLGDGAGQDWGYVSDGVYSLEFEFVTETFMTARIQRTSSATPSQNRSFELANITLSGAVDNFKFYVSGTESDIPANSLYVNNLQVSEVPEPGTYALIAGTLALLCVAMRRRG